jgi:hypothetical protein
LAVTIATLRPASWKPARIVGARMNLGSFIITSVPDAGSKKKLPAMPCTAGGRPVMIERLFGLVKLGITHSAIRFAPTVMKRAKFGARPASIAFSI